MVTYLAIIIAGYLLAMAASEVVLRGSKLQARLLQVLCVYAATGAVLLGYLRLSRATSIVAFAIWWLGAFLSWFGVRSHIESSILLQMVCMLNKRSTTSAELQGEYESVYGPEQRLEELVQARLMERGSVGIEVTPKGKLIARLAALLQ